MRTVGLRGHREREEVQHRASPGLLDHAGERPRTPLGHEAGPLDVDGDKQEGDAAVVGEGLEKCIDLSGVRLGAMVDVVDVVDDHDLRAARLDVGEG
jgi:hypothetical protein